VFFFLSVINICGSKNALIFDISIFFDDKLILVGTFNRSTLKMQGSFRIRQKKPKKKNKKKW